MAEIAHRSSSSSSSCSSSSSTLSASLSTVLPQKSRHGWLFDQRRKAQLARGAVNCHDGEVHCAPTPDFDISKTVFKTLDPALWPAVRQQYGQLLFWSDRAIERIDREAGAILGDESSRWAAVQQHSEELLKFMREDCDFDCEHADGSFLDHLQFCYKYCHVHFPAAASPVVLFLHSIMGVGTNLFPMLLEQRPKLSTLVSQQDLLHIECFPTVLRLQTDLLDELLAMPKTKLQQVDGITCYRLLGPDMRRIMCSDNAPLTLRGMDFWKHLNYQLIHFLDFLPASDWDASLHSGMFPPFIGTHRVLQRAGHLHAQVEFDSAGVAARIRDSDTDATRAKRERGKLITRMFSGKIGHRLDYKLHYLPSFTTSAGTSSSTASRSRL